LRILVLINPLAGNGKTLKQLRRVKSIVETSPHSFSWKIAASAAELRREIQKAPREGVECLLLMGGDGTVHEALPALRQGGLPFGLLPCGRGNDFARNIGLALDLRGNCLIPRQPFFWEIDVPLLNDRPFGSIACLGFDAEVNKFARDRKGFFGGTLGYVICVLKALRTFKPFEAEIKVDDLSWRGRVMMVAISNGPYYGGGMKIAPQARMDDGFFDVCIIEEVSKGELLRQFPKVFRGTHVTHSKVKLISGRRVAVSAEENREVFADGEYVGNIPCTAEFGEPRIRVLRPTAPVMGSTGHGELGG
jgi:diacylglycerol kinase (ATP)